MAASLAVLSLLLGPRWLAEPPLSLAGAGVQLLLDVLLVLALVEAIPGTPTGAALPALTAAASALAFLGFLTATAPLRTGALVTVRPPAAKKR